MNAYVRFNIPLLPFKVDLQLGISWRPLPRFRLPLWSLMLVIAAAAAFFAAARHMSQLGVMNRHHAEQMRLDIANQQWHFEMTNKYASAISRLDAWVALGLLLASILLLACFLGRLLNRFGGQRRGEAGRGL